jgi:hypothetical protein
VYVCAQLKAPPKSKGILEQIMALYQSGFEGTSPHMNMRLFAKL